MKPDFRQLAAGSLSLWAAQALAHEGHGLPGSAHWHASDTFGLLLVGGMAAAALWFWLGGKGGKR